MPGNEFEAKVSEISELNEWIIDGNYKNTFDIRLQNADSVIWLDYKMPKVLYRILKRTLTKFITQEVLWKNNRQSFRKAFHPRESIILYSLKTYKRKVISLHKK